MPDKTWFCWIPSIGGDLATGHGALIRAPTAGKARYLCLLNAREPWPDLTFADIKVRREPAYDRAEFRDGWSPRYATFPRDTQPATAR